MSERSNIERFDELTGEILATLYRSFPVPKNLLPAEFVNNPTEYNEAVQADVPSEETRFFIATAEWLRVAGYLWADPQDGHGHIVRNCVLTPKGLEVLKVKPSNLDDADTLGEQLVTATQQGGKDAARKAVGDVLNLGARFLIGLGSP